MAESGESKACTSCAKAKRKCGKQTPICQRCSERGVECYYPPSKLSSFITQTESPDSLSDVVDQDMPFFSPGSALENNIDLDLGLLIPSHANVHTSILADCFWFLSPDTWKIDHYPKPNAVTIGAEDLERYVRLNHHWLNQWISTGSNPYLHAHLYQHRFPSSLQIAFAVLSSYNNRTESNNATILKIVEDRSTELLKQNGIILDILGVESNLNETPTESMDLLEQLARVHSLMVYQTISLFDGDIRSRWLAENRFPILTRWTQQILETPRRDYSRLSLTSDSLLSPQIEQPLRESGTCNRKWHAWILAESIRRTWLVAMGLHAVYYTLQQRWTVCAGGIMFTNRQGVWQADSAVEWERLCSQKNVRFMQRFQADKLFDEAFPAEVDEFGKTMLEFTFGPERMKQWG
jgi:hypothetical protein